MNAYAAYGVQETNNIADSAVQLDDVEYGVTVQFEDPELVKIVRLRLLSDPGFPYWDVSYCWGQLKDGRVVHVSLPVQQFSRRRPLRPQLVGMAQSAGRYAKGLGLLDETVISKLV